MPTDALDALERIQHAISRADSSLTMFDSVLDEMLDVFDCDRVWLQYPCDPTAASVRIHTERTRPEWPGAAESGEAFPITPRVADLMRACLDSTGVVRIDPERQDAELEPEPSARYGVRSTMVMAIRPIGDRPWMLGIHNCSEAHVYESVARLYVAVGRRIEDGLTSFIATEGLRQSEERLRTIVEHAPEAIVILDADRGCFVEANPVAAKLFGVTLEELLDSRGPIDFSPEFQPDGSSSSDAARQRIAEALAGETPCFEWMHENGDGAPLPCEVRLVRLPHPTRRLLRGSILDISERRRAENERADLQARLAHSQRMEAVGRLSGGIAHDFNNLLTVITVNLELLEESREDLHGAAESLADIRSAADRARSLTHQLLAFSRRQPLNPTAVDVSDLLRSMHNLLRRTLPEDIEIDVSVDADLWKCEVDETQLQNAILNLAINARDAMQHGGRLAIRAENALLDESFTDHHPDLEPGPFVRVAVSDSGVGIPDEDLDQVFSPFFTTKGVGGGSGLGLSMVYGFVTQSGGHVEARSEPGAGTTMIIHLPRASRDSVVRAPVPESPEIERGDGVRVLVVEDSDAVRRVVCSMLRGLGYDVSSARDGAAALDVLESSPDIDLLITDIVMPGRRNGAQLAREVQARRPGIAVLYMSGYAEDAILHHGRLDPGVHLVEKPFTKRTLSLAIQKVFADRDD